MQPSVYDFIFSSLNFNFTISSFAHLPNILFLLQRPTLTSFHSSSLCGKFTWIFSKAIKFSLAVLYLWIKFIVYSFKQTFPSSIRQTLCQIPGKQRWKVTQNSLFPSSRPHTQSLATQSAGDHLDSPSAPFTPKGQATQVFRDSLQLTLYCGLIPLVLRLKVQHPSYFLIPSSDFPFHYCYGKIDIM